MQTPDILPLLRLLEEARYAGRLTEAVSGARALSQLQPDNLKARQLLARSLFDAGLWEEAWEAYEVRFDLMPEHFVKVMRHGPTGPEPIGFWRDGKLPEALLVMGEQGLGDTIQFARFLPMLRARGVRVHAVLDPRVHKLLSPVLEGIDLHAAGKSGRVRGGGNLGYPC